MRFGRLLPALSVMVAAGALIVLTGTGAAATQPGRSAPAANAASLAAPAALDSYLRAIGVSRASLVTQRGTRNYAGPNCPGKGWTCTTSTRVLQIAADHGKNKVDCPAGSIGPGPSQSCTIVQVGAKNSAKCQQRSDSSAAVQYCSITQTGKNNHAEVHQTVHAENAASQTATQTAFVQQTQTSNGGSNKSQVKQDVKQKAKDGSSSQDAQQSADIDQETMGKGTNDSNVDQDQNLSAHGSAAIQSQNTSDLGVPDCAPSGGPWAPNACANVNQSSDAGGNKSRIKQSIKEDEKSNVSADQAQGWWGGGLDGAVHQETGPSGNSRNDAGQDEHQDMSSPGGSQTQWDPIRCCGVGSQVGGTGNSEKIDQRSTQKASDGNAFQQLELRGESVSPTGSCAVTQEGRNNSADANNAAAFSPCPFLVLETSCSSGGESETGFCTESEPITTPPCSECDFAGPLFALLRR